MTIFSVLPAEKYSPVASSAISKVYRIRRTERYLGYNISEADSRESVYYEEQGPQDEPALPPFFQAKVHFLITLRTWCGFLLLTETQNFPKAPKLISLCLPAGKYLHAPALLVKIPRPSMHVSTRFSCIRTEAIHSKLSRSVEGKERYRTRVGRCCKTRGSHQAPSEEQGQLNQVSEASNC